MSKEEYQWMESFSNALKKKATCGLVDLIKEKSVEILLIQQELYNREIS